MPSDSQLTDLSKPSDLPRLPPELWTAVWDEMTRNPGQAVLAKMMRLDSTTRAVTRPRLWTRMTLTIEGSEKLFNYILETASTENMQQKRSLIETLNLVNHITVAGAFNVELMENAQNALLHWWDEFDGVLYHLASMSICSDIVSPMSKVDQFNIFPLLHGRNLLRCTRLSGPAWARSDEHARIREVFELHDMSRRSIIHVSEKHFEYMSEVFSHRPQPINRLFRLPGEHNVKIDVETAMDYLATLPGLTAATERDETYSTTEVVDCLNIMAGDTELYWPPSSEQPEAGTSDGQMRVYSNQERKTPRPAGVKFTFSRDGSASPCEICETYDGVKGEERLL